MHCEKQRCMSQGKRRVTQKPRPPAPPPKPPPPHVPPPLAVLPQVCFRNVCWLRPFNWSLQTSSADPNAHYGFCCPVLTGAMGQNTVFWIERPDQPCFDFVRTSAMPKVKATTCPPGFQDFSLLKLLRSCPIWPQCWPTAPWHSLDTRQRSGRCSSLSLRKSRPAGGGKRLDLSDLDWSAKFQTKTHLNLYPCHES